MNQNLAKPFFVVEGNIGAGKSTFLRLVKQEIPLQLVYEPLKEWQEVEGENLLEKFYQDIPRWAYTFQSYAFVTRVIKQVEYARVNEFPAQLLERSVYSDRYCFALHLHEEGILSPLEWHLYVSWFDWTVRNNLRNPTGFVYLRTDPAVSYARLQKRGREEEGAVPLEYLKALHEKHESWLVRRETGPYFMPEVPILVLDCDHDFENNSTLLRHYVQELKNFIAPFIQKSVEL